MDKSQAVSGGTALHADGLHVGGGERDELSPGGLGPSRGEDGAALYRGEGAAEGAGLL